MSPRKIARGERFNISPDERSLAQRRTEFLLNMTHRSLEDLIANAWVQGVIDTAEHMTTPPSARDTTGRTLGPRDASKTDLPPTNNLTRKDD